MIIFKDHNALEAITVCNHHGRNFQRETEVWLQSVWASSATADSIVEYITWAVFCLKNLRMMMGRRWVEMMDDHGPPRVRKPLSDLGKNNPGLQYVKMGNVEVSILTSWCAVGVRLTSRCYSVGIVMTATAKLLSAKVRPRVPTSTYFKMQPIHYYGRTLFAQECHNAAAAVTVAAVLW